jgi:hypothetical protein
MRRLTLLASASSAACSLLIATDDLSTRDATPARADAAFEDALTDVIPDVVSSTDAGSDAADGAGQVVPAFSDDFERADGPVGNGWIEKTAGSFSLVSGSVVPEAGDYRSFMIYRPPSEDVLDTVASMDVKFDAVPGASPSNDPQIMVRLQAASLGVPGVFDGYMAWLDNGLRFKVGRQNGSALNIFREVDLQAPVDTAHEYRLKLTVTGTYPVSINARLERLDATWTLLEEFDVADTDASRVAYPGSVGTAADDAVSFRYDNFSRNSL